MGARCRYCANVYVGVFFFCQGRISLLRTKLFLIEWFSIECRKLFCVWFGFASQRSLIGSKKSSRNFLNYFDWFG